MSPEQIRGEVADARSDIFALGVILYEMLTRRRAFQKPTSAETMSAILNEEPSPISQLAPATPPALQHFVHRCFGKNADKRFQNASDVAFALEALSDSSSISVPAKMRVSSTRRWSWRTGAQLAAFIVLVVAAFWFLSSGAWLRRRADPSALLPMRLELRLLGASFFALSPNGEQIAACNACSFRSRYLGNGRLASAVQATAHDEGYEPKIADPTDETHHRRSDHNSSADDFAFKELACKEGENE